MTITFSRILLASLVAGNCIAALQLYAVRSARPVELPGPEVLLSPTGTRLIPDRGTLVTMSGDADPRTEAVLHRLAQFRYLDDVNWLQVSRAGTAPGFREGVLRAGTYVVNMEAASARALLRVSSAARNWFLYDAGGTLRASGDLIDGGIESALAQLVAGESDFTDQLVLVEFGRLDAAGMFAQERALAGRSASGRHHVLFVAAALSGCGIQGILHDFGSAALNATGAELSLVVPADWTLGDVEALRANLDVHGRIVHASEQLTRVWDDIAWKYGRNSATGFLVTFSPSGLESAVTSPSEVQRVLKEIAGGSGTRS